LREGLGDAKVVVLVSTVVRDAVAPRARIDSVDIVRGMVMVLMAIDHVRVYSGVPAGGPTAGVFFTRWVTHFCAPAFVFFAGTGAYLHGRKVRDRGKLAAAFGSYGWSGEAVGIIESNLRGLKFKVIQEAISSKFFPHEQKAQDFINFGKCFAEQMAIAKVDEKE
jgi:hypothetical protein